MTDSGRTHQTSKGFRESRPKVEKSKIRFKDEKLNNIPNAKIKSKSESNKDDKKEDLKKEEPNFGLSGKLLEDTNQFNGVVIKYSQPEEAAKSSVLWRLYEFKEENFKKTLYIHRESAYLIGKDRRVADIPIDHPSCSKQHAVIQYRKIDGQRDARPYLIDLESANGTFLNAKKIEPRRYYELLEKDVIKFGYSSRDYVLMRGDADTTQFDSSGDEEIAKEDLISD